MSNPNDNARDPQQPPPYGQPPAQPYAQPNPYAQPPMHASGYPQAPYAQPQSAPQPYPPAFYPAPDGPAPWVPPAVAPVAHPALPLDPRARNAAVALFACCALMLIGIISHAWFTAGSDGGIGLLGLEECRHSGACHSMNWFDIPRVPDEIKLFVGLGVLGIAGAMGFLIHAGVVLLKGAADKVRLGWANGLLGVAAFGSLAFLLRLSLGRESHGLSLSWAGFAALAGILGAAALLTATVRPLARR